MKCKLFLLIGLATLLFFTTPVKAQSKNPPLPNPPPQYNYVLDTLNWLSASQEQDINTIARQLDLEGKAQIYVATLNNCGIDKTLYRSDLFNAWKIGAQKNNGGLLILVCWYDGDQSQRSVEVKTDAKMQIIIPDAVTAKTAENNFVPAFKENQPGAGLVKMVMTFNGIIRDQKGPKSSDNSWLWLMILLLPLFFVDWKCFLRGQGLRWVRVGSGRHFGGRRHFDGRRHFGSSSGLHFGDDHYNSGGGGGGGDDRGGGSSTNF
jgi:uncharacterized protein